MYDFSDKVFLVTGASSGLGEVTARKLAHYGAKVALAARRSDACDAIVSDIIAAGGDAFTVQTDVGDKAAIVAMVAKTVGHFGRLDGAVNNAGITGSIFVPVAEVEEDDWQSVIDINLSSVWRCMKAEIPELLKSGGGSIVNMSSMYGLIGGEMGNSGYVASKFGVIGLTKTAAIDYGQQGIRVNAVCPGFCHSEMVDPFVEAEKAIMDQMVARYSATNRLGEGEEVADAVAWLLSDTASFVSGAAIPVQGGGSRRIY